MGETRVADAGSTGALARQRRYSKAAVTADAGRGKDDKPASKTVAGGSCNLNDAKRSLDRKVSGGCHDIAKRSFSCHFDRQVSGGSDRSAEDKGVAEWSFEVLMEEPTIEHEERTLNGEVAFFHFRVFVQERHTSKGRGAGCRELSWRLRRRQSDFRRLDTALRGADVLPDSLVLPKNSFLQHLLPSQSHVRQRAGELLAYLRAALRLALAAGVEEAAIDPEGCPDCLGVSQVLTQFLGLKDSHAPPSCDSDSDEERREGPLMGRWRLPRDAAERQAALVYSIDKGVYIWGHHQEGSECRIKRVDKKATLGELVATHAEYRGSPSESKTSSFGSCASPGWSPQISPSPWPASPHRLPASSSSPQTPIESLLPSPCLSPRRASWDEEDASCSASVWSLSTADTEAMMAEMESRPKNSAAVWLEVNLDTEVARRQEHAKWATRVAASRDPDHSAKEVPAPEAARRRMVEDLERTAVLYRELAQVHESLHPVLGYGVDRKSFVMVQEAAPGCHGLRGLPFSPQRCQRVMFQVLSGLVKLHEQQIAHGYISPESLVVNQGPMGPQVRIAWTPGQRRTEGHTGATVGFRAPEAEAGAAGDIWAFACVVLVWWTDFATAPHPWTQFAKSGRPQHNIQEALAKVPPELPRALLDLHAAAASAEEPEQTFLHTLSNLLTRCFCWEAPERPSAAKLLQHRFFEQAL